MGKGFGAVYSPKEEETAPNGLPLDLSIFNEAGYLCIRHKGINDWDKSTIKVAFDARSKDGSNSCTQKT